MSQVTMRACERPITHHLAIAGHPGPDRPNNRAISQSAVTQQLFPHPKLFKKKVGAL